VPVLQFIERYIPYAKGADARFFSKVECVNILLSSTYFGKNVKGKHM